MRTRRFGRTELAMPVLSCGGMRYQHKWQDLPLADIPAEGQRNLEATIERAFELGVRHIETARGYGSSERQLGQILPRLPRGELIVQTKVAPTSDAATFVSHVEESLERLRLDHVDLLALHGVNSREELEWSLRPGGCFDAAQELRRAGKVRFVGFSTHAPLDLILEAVRHGSPETGRGFDYVNLHYYFILQSNWPAIAEAAARDMGVFIISPSDKGGRLYEPPAELVELCAPYSPMVFNDLFCLAHPEIHTLSVGAARPSDFDEHVRAVELSDDAAARVAPIVERLRARLEARTGVRDPEAFGAGVPAWEDAPARLNLRAMLWLHALATGWGMVEYGKKRFNLMGNGGHWFPGAAPEKLRDVSDETLGRALAGALHGPSLVPRLRASLELLGGASVRRESAS